LQGPTCIKSYLEWEKEESSKRKITKSLDIWSGYEKDFILFQTEGIVFLPPESDFAFRIIESSIDVALKIVRDQPFKVSMTWQLWGSFTIELNELLLNCIGFKQFLRLKIIELLLDLFTLKLEEFSQVQSSNVREEIVGYQ